MWNSCPKFVPTFQLHPVNTLYIQQSWWQWTSLAHTTVDGYG
jgi:hypothetical protein